MVDDEICQCTKCPLVHNVDHCPLTLGGLGMIFLHAKKLFMPVHLVTWLGSKTGILLHTAMLEIEMVLLKNILRDLSVRLDTGSYWIVPHIIFMRLLNKRFWDGGC